MGLLWWCQCYKRPKRSLLRPRLEIGTWLVPLYWITNASHKSSSDSRYGEIESISLMKEQQSHIMKGVVTGKASEFGTGLQSIAISNSTCW